MSFDRQAVLLCEGVHDRAFLAGWLIHLGWTDPTRDGRIKIRDRFGVVERGRFAFDSPNGRTRVRVEPCGGETEVSKRALDYLRGLATEPFEQLSIILDGDVFGDRRSSPSDWLRTLARKVTPGVAVPASAREVVVDGCRVSLGLLVGESEPAPGIPAQQCLERVVCTALARIYPNRAAAVAAWLDGRPEPLGALAKAHAWSFMAGWSADAGCDGFYRRLWADGGVAADDGEDRQDAHP